MHIVSTPGLPANEPWTCHLRATRDWRERMPNKQDTCRKGVIVCLRLEQYVYIYVHITRCCVTCMLTYECQVEVSISDLANGVQIEKKNRRRIGLVDWVVLLTEGEKGEQNGDKTTVIESTDIQVTGI